MTRVSGKRYQGSRAEPEQDDRDRPRSQGSGGERRHSSSPRLRDLDRLDVDDGRFDGQRGRPPARRQSRALRDEPPPYVPQRGRGHTLDQSFKCGHCKRFIGPLPSGGHNRNHCPVCLYSRHVDDLRSGDRASTCKSLMEPIGAFQRPNGEHVVVHRCLGCEFERFNRIAADDDFDLILALPVVPARSAKPAGAFGGFTPLVQ